MWREQAIASFIVLALWCVSTVALAPPASAAALERGDESNLVTHLQLELQEFGFYRGPVDGRYGPMTAQAVMAFHKHLGLERTFEWRDGDWLHLMAFEPIAHAGSVGVDVDLDRQVLYFHDEDGSVSVAPVSTGNGEAFVNWSGRTVTARTPTGEFSFYRHVDGARESYLGTLWRPWYFYGGYAIHGSSSVPPYPASHGCVRIPNWDADWFASELAIGMSVSVYRGGPIVPPELDPPPPMDRERILEMAE